MTDTTQDPTAVPAPSGRAPRTVEKTVWWITFGVIVFAIIAMLSLWN
jgi:hypothetical protein